MHPPPRIAPSTLQLHNTKNIFNCDALPTYKSGGRLYYLLTLKLDTFWLTKVNKIICNEQIVNKLQHTSYNLWLQQKSAELTKSVGNKNNQTMYISSDSMPGSAVVQEPIRVPTRSVEALGTGLFFFGSFLLEKQKK